MTQAKSSASPAGVQVNGTVAADKPDGVTVTLKGISLVDEEAQSAENFDEVADAAQFASSGKTSPASFLLQLPQARVAKRKRPACSVVAECSAVTTDDGTWSIPDVEAPGYYLVTFTKPGYDSQRFVIDAATFDPTEPLEVEMLPGDGGLSGLVRGPNGKPLGGATVTVSDGTSTITTSTASRGKVGRWEVSGLETPASYLVEVSSYGLGTESRLVDLGPSDVGTADMRLKAGIAVLRGEITDGTSDGARRRHGRRSATATATCAAPPPSPTAGTRARSACRACRRPATTPSPSARPASRPRPATSTSPRGRATSASTPPWCRPTGPSPARCGSSAAPRSSAPGSRSPTAPTPTRTPRCRAPRPPAAGRRAASGSPASRPASTSSPPSTSAS